MSKTQVIVEWRQQEFINKITRVTLNGMDKACAFVAEQADARAPERTGKMKGLISYEVVTEGKDIVGRVGVKHGGFYAIFQEFGTSKMAAQPFLRPAVFQNKAKILKLLGGK